MPTVRDMDRHMYIREWSGGILAGCFEVDGRSCFQDGIPDSFEFQLLPEDWNHIRKLIKAITGGMREAILTYVGHGCVKLWAWLCIQSLFLAHMRNSES